MGGHGVGEWRDLIGLAVSALLGGGVWKTIEVWRAGRKARTEAEATERRVVEVLHRSRAYLLDLIAQYRRRMREHGIPEDEIGPLPDQADPWELYRRRTEDD